MLVKWITLTGTMTEATTTKPTIEGDALPPVPDEAGSVPEQCWFTTRTAQAKALFPSITDAVSTRIEELLSGAFSDRQQTPTELKAIAWELLKANDPAPPKSEAPQ